MNNIQKLIEAEKKASCVSTVGCAARNAMPEIVELVGLLRTRSVYTGVKGPLLYDEKEANRIREIVGEK